VRDLPPGGVIPQAPAAPRRRCRDLVTGGAVGRIWGEASDTKLQQSNAICGGLIAISVTTMGMHDNVAPQRFPTLIFLQ